MLWVVLITHFAEKNMMPRYDLDKIKFGVDPKTWERAVALYEGGKVTEFEESYSGYTAVVLGTQPYDVAVSERYYDHGDCNCFVGQRDELCKHMVALAIYAIMRGAPMKADEKTQKNDLKFSGKAGVLSKEELNAVKNSISEAMRYIKAYSGPSKTWFAYQNSLSEGCNRLSAIVSELPASAQTAGLIVDLLLRLDKKACSGGVDDSDGTIGGFIEGAVDILLEFVKIDKNCATAFKKLKNVDTCFDWEEPLVKLKKPAKK
jgi:hypothetical protein